MDKPLLALHDGVVAPCGKSSLDLAFVEGIACMIDLIC